MTVGELITVLLKMPRNTRVMLDAYERGLCEAREANLIPVDLNRHYPPGVYGPHDFAKPGGPCDEMAIYLPRNDGAIEESEG